MRPGRHWILKAGLVAVASLMLLSGLPGCSSNSPQTKSVKPEPKTELPNSTLIEEVTNKIRTDGPTLELSRLLFSLTFSPLEGVTIPKGEIGSVLDGSDAIDAMYDVWPQLSPTDRQAVRDVLNPPDSEGLRVEQSPPVVSVPAVWHGSGGGVDAPRLKPVGYSRDDPRFWTELLTQANIELSAALGAAPVPSLIVYTQTKENKTGGWANTSLWSAPEEVGMLAGLLVRLGLASIEESRIVKSDGSCHVLIFTNMFEGEPDSSALMVMTHEMMHCYQSYTAGTLEAMMSIGAWVKEGEANWAALTLHPTPDFWPIKMAWSDYYTQPSVHFDKRGYDGVGLFGHMSDVSGGPAVVWAKLLPVVTAGIRSSAAALELLMEGNRKTYLDTWGSSYFGRPESAAWTMGGPALAAGWPPIVGRKINVTGDNGAQLPDVNPWETKQFELSTGGSDVVGIFVPLGFGQVGDADLKVDTAVINSGVTLLCLKSGGCECPQGSPGFGYSLQDATAPIRIGLAGGETGASGYAKGSSTLEEFCKDPESAKKLAEPFSGDGGGGSGVPSDAPECAAGCTQPSTDGPETGNPGVSQADPHLRTFDQQPFEFQTVGEYQLTASTVDDFAVQTRQQPVDRSRYASSNTAVVVRSGGHRVTLSTGDTQAVVSIDGKKVNEQQSVAGGLRIGRAVGGLGLAVTVSLEDGTVVQIDSIANYGLSVAVTLAAERAGKVDGLLGNDNGVKSDDFTAPDGTELAFPLSAAAVQTLASEWRVTSTSSLFDYEPPQAVGSFDDETFPDPETTATEVERAAAQAVCQDAGITDEELLTNCIFDVLATQKTIFSGSFAGVQRVINAQPTDPSAAPTSHTFTGQIEDKQKHSFTARKGDVIAIGDGGICGHADPNDDVLVELAGPDGNLVSAQAACRFGRQVLPATGTYTVRVSDSGRTGAYRIVVTGVRPDRVADASVGDVLDGNIAFGAHDVYQLNVAPGSAIVLNGDGCTTSQPGLSLGFYKKDGSLAELAVACRDTPIVLADGGKYSLVVNSAEPSAWTGTYHIPIR